MECYDRTLRAHHNVMSRSVYTVAAKAIPYREDMLRALGLLYQSLGSSFIDHLPQGSDFVYTMFQSRKRFICCQMRYCVE